MKILYPRCAENFIDDSSLKREAVRDRPLLLKALQLDVATPSAILLRLLYQTATPDEI